MPTMPAAGEALAYARERGQSYGVHLTFVGDEEERAPPPRRHPGARRRGGRFPAATPVRLPPSVDGFLSTNSSVRSPRSSPWSATRGSRSPTSTRTATCTSWRRFGRALENVLPRFGIERVRERPGRLPDPSPRRARMGGIALAPASSSCVLHDRPSACRRARATSHGRTDSWYIDNLSGSTMEVGVHPGPTTGGQTSAARPPAWHPPRPSSATSSSPGAHRLGEEAPTPHGGRDVESHELEHRRGHPAGARLRAARVGRRAQRARRGRPARGSHVVGPVSFSKLWIPSSPPTVPHRAPEEVAEVDDQVGRDPPFTSG